MATRRSVLLSVVPGIAATSGAAIITLNSGDPSEADEDYDRRKKYQHHLSQAKQHIREAARLGRTGRSATTIVYEPQSRVYAIFE